MENFDEVIFDDEELDLEDTHQEPPTNQSPDQNDTDEGDLTLDILRLRGISDPNKIKFEDESGAIVERSWDSLSKEEQINILTEQTQEQNDLDNSEIALINTIRESGMTPEDYIKSLQPQPEQIKRYDIDDLSDDEVYALDLLHKVGSDISDDEINQALEAAKKNEDLYKKTIEGLRKEYIRLQEQEEAQMANERAAQEQEAYNRFSNNIMRAIGEMDSFAGQSLQLSNNDVEDLSSFILDIDDQGLSSFGKALNDPKLLTKAAFWILNEDKIVEELSKQIQENYRRGYEQAKIDLQGGSKSKLVFTKPASQKKTTNDVFIDDEDWF